MTRFLLSHNFTLSQPLSETDQGDRLTLLDREAFTQVFQTALANGQPSETQGLSVRQLSHAHWAVEILVEGDRLSPTEVGQWCVQALVARRQADLGGTVPTHRILVLGGLKQTPPTSADPETLQPGEWGCDVVETESVEGFLGSIAWESTISQRDPATIFKVVR